MAVGIATSMLATEKERQRQLRYRPRYTCVHPQPEADKAHHVNRHDIQRLARQRTLGEYRKSGSIQYPLLAEDECNTLGWPNSQNQIVGHSSGINRPPATSKNTQPRPPRSSSQQKSAEYHGGKPKTESSSAMARCTSRNRQICSAPYPLARVRQNGYHQLHAGRNGGNSSNEKGKYPVARSPRKPGRAENVELLSGDNMNAASVRSDLHQPGWKG